MVKQPTYSTCVLNLASSTLDPAPTARGRTVRRGMHVPQGFALMEPVASPVAPATSVPIGIFAVRSKFLFQGPATGMSICVSRSRRHLPWGQVPVGRLVASLVIVAVGFAPLVSASMHAVVVGIAKD